VNAGRIETIQAGVLTIRRSDGTTFSIRPAFVAGDPNLRVGDRVSADRGRIWKIAAAGPLSTK
jgi:hypothetical protein